MEDDNEIFLAKLFKEKGKQWISQAVKDFDAIKDVLDGYGHFHIIMAPVDTGYGLDTEAQIWAFRELIHRYVKNNNLPFKECPSCYQGGAAL